MQTPGLASQLVPVPSRAVCPLAINFAPPPHATLAFLVALPLGHHKAGVV